MKQLRRPAQILPALLSLLLAVPGAAAAQTPLGPARLDVATSPDNQLVRGVALDGQGVITLVWAQLSPGGAAGATVVGRRFGADDQPLGKDIVFEATPSFVGGVAANQSGRYVVSWTRNRRGARGRDVVVRTAGPGVKTRTLVANGPEALPRGAGKVAIDRAGNFVVVWPAETRAGTRVFGQRFNANGSKRGPEFNVSTFPGDQGEQGVSSVAMNPLTGEFVVVWAGYTEDGIPEGIFGQRFGFFTGRQGGSFQVSVTALQQQVAVNVGRANDGSFVVVWSQRRTGEPVTDVFAQRFDLDANWLGSEIRVAEASPITDGYARMAMDPEGNFIVAWDDGFAPLYARLFHKDGTPAGPIREIAPLPHQMGSPEVAFGWNGTFVLAATDFIGHTPDEEWEAAYQRFAASPGAEACFYLNGRFHCLGTKANAPGFIHSFGGNVAGTTPLLGDVDGDGRDDFCVYRDGRFLCDTAHNSGAAETQFIFGAPGDIPLLGDLNGDRRDDPCVYRNGHFLCDSARDGGAPEIDIAFGFGADVVTVPLIADADRDGRDDPCFFTHSDFFCDTVHNGGAAELILNFGYPSATAVFLIDWNGDGWIDPCVLGNGGFQCDLNRDDSVDFTLPYASLGVPLLGNLDGL
ncbi:MAG: hypothetical protein ACJ75H_21530 [Thermoanaerobaculia bacterium]